MNLLTDNFSLRRFLPNVIQEVDNETSLYDKLYPVLERNNRWLDINILGSVELSEPIADLARRVIAVTSMAEMVPALDLVLTPNGFGIVSTDSLTPASKERVERLIDSLYSSANANLVVLVDELRRLEEWRSGVPGRRFGGTMLSSLADIERWADKGNIFARYNTVRNYAIMFERELAERYLGSKLLAQLRSARFAYASTDDETAVTTMIMAMESDFIDYRLSPRPTEALCRGLWQAVRPIIESLKYYPSLYAIWNEDMGPTFNTETFENSVCGAYYF
jgi:hypothetical protein